MILLNSTELNCCSLIKVLHGSDDTFAQPQSIMLLRLSSEMKLPERRLGLNVSQNMFPKMNQRTRVSFVEKALAILTNEVPVDSADSMLDDPGHETSCF